MARVTETTVSPELLEFEGAERVVGGNTPFFLDDPASVWLVLAGKVEVFCVEVVDGEPHGPRHHYLSAEPGDALFGIDLQRYGEGLGLLAVGVVGTRLRQVSVDRFRVAGPLVFDLVDRWISGLSRGVSRGIVPQPRANLLLEPGGQGELPAGGRLRAQRGVVWVSQLEGASLFIGMEEVPDTSPDAVFPLTHDTFLQALSPARYAAIDSATAVGTGAGWAGLETFYESLFRCEFFNTRLAAADELNRLKERADRDRRNQEAALAGLAAVIEQRSAEFDEVPGDDPLLAACTVIGRRMGFAVQAPPTPKDGEPVGDPLREIVRASRVRMRKVLLRGDWWAHETWPLLAFIEEDERPVVILPGRPGRFELHDPASRTRTPLSREVAAQLSAIGYMFYRPFPAKTLTPLDLVRFGMRNNGRDLLRPLILGIMAGILGVVPPFFLGLMVDEVIPNGQRVQLLQLAMILAVIGITTAAFGIVRQLSILRLEVKMSAAVQPAIWDHLLGLPVAFFRQFSAGDLAQRAACIDNMRRLLSGATISSIMTSVFSVFLLAQLFYYSWQLALWATGLVALALAFAGLIALLRLRLHRPAMEIEGRISGLVLQLLTGVPKLRVAGAEGRAFAVWAREFAQQKRLSLRGGRIENCVETYNVVFPVFSAMLIFSIVLHLTGQQLASGERPMSAGDFVAFNIAFGMFLLQMLALGEAGLSILTIVPLFERAKPLLEEARETDDTKADPGELSGRIDVEHVTFRYQPNGPPILDDVSVHINPGEYVALVGPSGSGKSTLARLLLGLEVPESGSIYYDGRELSTLDVQKLRRKIGVVMQTGKVRAGSLLENIIGSTPLTIDDAWEAARQAGLEEDIREMPMGMQTIVQQTGGTLSGGQRQRLMIARAIVNRPRILVFDEATSALDNRTQAVVTASLERLQATRIAIAHRLSTIMGADRIYVLENGRVVEEGTYAELATGGGLFADLIRRQVA